jgi:YVTN family beta-propeller protein
MRRPISKMGYPALASLLVACGMTLPGNLCGGPAPLRLLVSNEDSGDVSIIDLAKGEVTATVPVGKRPRGIKLGPDKKSVFVALSGSAKAGPGVDESKLPPADRAADGVGVLDVDTGQLLKVLKTGQDPESFDLTADGKTLFVSNEETGEASVVDLGSGQVTTRIPVGDEPEGVKLRPDGKVLYVTSEVGNQIAAIDVASRKVIATIEVGPRPRGIVFTPDGKTAFITCEQGGEVAVLDAQAHTRRNTIVIDPTKAKPMGAVLSPDAKTLYVSNGRGGTVSIIDVASEKIVGTITDVGVRPWGIAISPDGALLYTANGPSNDVSVIDLSTKTVTKRIKVGRSPWGLTFSR